MKEKIYKTHKIVEHTKQFFSFLLEEFLKKIQIVSYKNLAISLRF